MFKVALFCVTLTFFPVLLFAAEKRPQTVPPKWIEEPTGQYPEGAYMTAVGEGYSQKEAETAAIEALAAVFSRKIESQTQSSLQYARGEGVQTGHIDKRIHQTVSISTNIDTLMGVEIKERWVSSEGVHAALAVLNKSKAAALYSEHIKHNNESIRALLDVPASMKGTFAQFARYKAAYTQAEENAAFFSVLAQLNTAAAAAVRDEQLAPSTIKEKWLGVLKHMPIAVTVDGDSGDKIKSSFSKIFASEGFTLASKNNYRYAMTATLTLSDEKIQENKKTLVRYTLDAAFTDTLSGEILIPFSLTGREIHLNKQSAEVRVFKTLDKKITEKFKAAFEAYILLHGK